MGAALIPFKSYFLSPLYSDRRGAGVGFEILCIPNLEKESIRLFVGVIIFLSPVVEASLLRLARSWSAVIKVDLILLR